VDAERFPRIATIERECLGLPAFVQAAPEQQLDRE
jgi:hypothetical protein